MSDNDDEEAIAEEQGVGKGTQGPPKQDLQRVGRTPASTQSLCTRTEQNRNPPELN